MVNVKHCTQSLSVHNSSSDLSSRVKQFGLIFFIYSYLIKLTPCMLLKTSVPEGTPSGCKNLHMHTRVGLNLVKGMGLWGA